MLKEERQRYILDLLHRQRKVLATELCAQLGVSEDTIRRDLRELDEAGLVRRVHGGALSRSPAATSYAARTQQAPEAKLAVARAALELVRDGQVILFDGGTTMVQVAQQLPPGLHATIITNSPPVALVLSEHASVDVVMLGGKLDKRSLVMVGAATMAALRGIRADLCLLGVCSVHPELGISVPDLEESHVKRAMIESAADVAALATAEKLDTVAPYQVAPLSAITHLVTEAAVGDAVLAPYRAASLTVLQA